MGREGTHVEIHWKTVAVFGGIGFFLSLLVGAVSGASFGTVLLRGVISAAVFGGIGLGLNVLIGKFLPGLVGDEAGGEQAEEDETGGVDIVIEEEVPRTVSEAAALSTDDDSDESFEEGSSFVEEVEEASSDETGSPAELAKAGNGVSAENGDESDEADEMEEVEELEEADEDGAGVRAAEVDGEVDSLPDIGDFSGSFSTGGDYDGEDGGDTLQSVEYSSGGNAPVEILGQEESPENVAKAVQTMLKRE
jgi:hypothetical protein